ncbi:hypothetical protein SUGI_0237210 [Cryptomeria japonica]|nr:hypothetical protein SUGI_0237210 [Cryptomeria japonica]
MMSERTLKISEVSWISLARKGVLHRKFGRFSKRISVPRIGRAQRSAAEENRWRNNDIRFHYLQRFQNDFTRSRSDLPMLQTILESSIFVSYIGGSDDSQKEFLCRRKEKLSVRPPRNIDGETFTCCNVDWTKILISPALDNRFLYLQRCQNDLSRIPGIEKAGDLFSENHGTGIKDFILYL